MRCKNCGWENQDGSLRCSKCNAPLSGSMVENNHPQSNSSSRNSSENPLNGTLKESSVFSEDNRSTNLHSKPRSCPKCGYPIHPDMKVCPSCGKSLTTIEESQGKQSSEKKCPKCGTMAKANENFCPNCGTPLRMGTVNNWMNPSQGVFCTLKPIAWNNEGVNYQPISYSGDTIVLTRSNTDPNNNSITSKEQAVLTHDGNDWFIENKSEQETTFIKVSKKTKLTAGDVIILGNRLFEFNG